MSDDPPDLQVKVRRIARGLTMRPGPLPLPLPLLQGDAVWLSTGDKDDTVVNDSRPRIFHPEAFTGRRSSLPRATISA